MATHESHSDENLSRGGSHDIDQDPDVSYMKLKSGQMFGIENKISKTPQQFAQFHNFDTEQNLERAKEVLPDSEIVYEIEKFTHQQLRTIFFRDPLINIFGEKFRGHKKLSDGFNSNPISQVSFSTIYFDEQIASNFENFIYESRKCIRRFIPNQMKKNCLPNGMGYKAYTDNTGSHKEVTKLFTAGLITKSPWLELFEWIMDNNKIEVGDNEPVSATNENPLVFIRKVKLVLYIYFKCMNEGNMNFRNPKASQDPSDLRPYSNF